jgi:hypothetical protein
MDSARLGSRNAPLAIVMSQLGLGHVKTLARLRDSASDPGGPLMLGGHYGLGPAQRHPGGEPVNAARKLAVDVAHENAGGVWDNPLNLPSAARATTN